MNANSLNALRNAAGSTNAARDVSDEKMDQVRELLLGDFAREAENRIAALEARFRDHETYVGQRLDALHSRLEAMAGELTGDRRAGFEELARGLSDLSEHVRRVAKT